MYVYIYLVVGIFFLRGLKWHKFIRQQRLAFSQSAWGDPVGGVNEIPIGFLSVCHRFGSNSLGRAMTVYILTEPEERDWWTLIT